MKKLFLPFLSALLVLLPAPKAAAQSFTWPSPPTSWQAGYMVDNNVPWVTATVTAPRPLGGQFSYIWVGMAGPDNQLVQAGITVGLSLFPDNYHWGWWATCGNCAPTAMGQPVRPGDVVKIAVNHLTGDHWRASLWDKTAGWAQWSFFTFPDFNTTAHLYVTEYDSSFTPFTFADAAPSNNPVAYTTNDNGIVATGNWTIEN